MLCPERTLPALMTIHCATLVNPTVGFKVEVIRVVVKATGPPGDFPIIYARAPLSHLWAQNLQRMNNTQHFWLRLTLSPASGAREPANGPWMSH